MRKGFSNSSSRVTAAALLSLVVGAGPAVSQVNDPSPAANPVFDVIAPLANDGTLGYFVAGDTDGGTEGSDAELCVWALNDWVRQAEGRLDVVPAPESDAVIRVYFVSPGAGRYGEMRPIRVGDLRGAEVYVRTETGTLGPDIAAAAAKDVLLRDTIVYLTCLHELGHALGMFHTAEFEDVMYFFGFGGDIPGFFGRYRSRLTARDDIALTSGLSAGDIQQLLTAYPND
jgi:hypothetical protein